MVRDRDVIEAYLGKKWVERVSRNDGDGYRSEVR